MFDFLKNLTVEDLSMVPSEYQFLYEAATEGGFALSEAGKPVAEAIGNLNKSLTAEKAKVKSLNTESADRRTSLAALTTVLTNAGMEVEEGADLGETATTFVTGLQSAGAGDDDLRINLDKERAAAKKQQTEMQTAFDAEKAQLQGSIQDLLISKDAATAIANAEGNPTLLLSQVENAAIVVQDGVDDRTGNPKYVTRIKDGDGDYLSDGKGGYVDMKGYVESLKANPEYAPAFTSNAKPGGGAPTRKQPNAMRTQINDQQADKSPKQKISAGLENLARTAQ